MKIIVSVGHLVRHYSLLLPFFFCGIGLLQAQEKEIRGTITADEFPLMNVAVQVQGVNQGTTTNIDGEYRINVQVGDTLIFSHLGYKTRQILITNQSQLDVELEPDATSLGAVEITGGYYSLEERTKTGNVTVVGRDQLDQQVIHSPLEALQGRVAGLEVQSVTGMRGQAPLVTLRGQSSVRGIWYNKPLYIVDGVQINSDGLESLSSLYDNSTGVDPLSTLDPSLIESIEILKDADATAIYGSRGANGVIIINTKRGKAGKTKFELQAETGVSWVGKFMDLMNTEQYLEMRREAFKNDGVEPTPSNAPDLLLWDQNRYTDWQKELIGGHANFQKYQGSISGGNTQTAFLISGGFQKETTVFPGSLGYQNNNIYANINHRSLNNRLSLNTSITYGYRKSNLFNVDVFVSNAILLPPNTPDLFNTKGEVNWELDEFGNPTFDNHMAGMANPNTMRIQSLQWNGNVDYKLLKGLTLKTNIGLNRLQEDETELELKRNLNPIYASIARSRATKRWEKREHLLIEPQLHYDFNVSKHRVNSLIGFTLQKNRVSRMNIQGEYYRSESQVDNISQAQEQRVLADEVRNYHYTAAFGRIGYSYDSKYYLNLTGRRDGSSRFGPGKQFGNFGAIGAAWEFYKERFIARTFPKLSTGKIRGSYGVTGNDDIGDYQYLDTYSNILIRSGSLSSGGLVPSKLYNSYYHWEKNTKLELALEVGLWEDRMSMSINWYRERSGNQLLDISLPYITGFSNVLGNFPATVENRGWEFILQTTPIKTTVFHWTFNTNITFPKNRLVAFPDLESSSYASDYIIGSPLGIRKLYNYMGVNPNTGKYTFEDINEDGVLNNDDKILTTNLSRKFYGGWYNNLQYKNWDISFLFEFVKQNGRDPITVFGPAGASNMPKEALDRWQSSNPNGKYQGYTQTYDAGFYDFIDTEVNIVDASFIRMKSLSISYRLSNQLLQKLGMKQAKVYINTRDLFTFTSYKGHDPQSSGSLGFPNLTSVNMGLKIIL